MFCTNCGSQLEEGALFCTQCGTRVQNDDFISAAPSRRRSLNRPQSSGHSPRLIGGSRRIIRSGRSLRKISGPSLRLNRPGSSRKYSRSLP